MRVMYFIAASCFAIGVLILLAAPGAWAEWDREPEDFLGVVLWALAFLGASGTSLFSARWWRQRRSGRHEEGT